MSLGTQCVRPHVDDIFEAIKLVARHVEESFARNLQQHFFWHPAYAQATCVTCARGNNNVYATCLLGTPCDDFPAAATRRADLLS